MPKLTKGHTDEVKKSPLEPATNTTQRILPIKCHNLFMTYYSPVMFSLHETVLPVQQTSKQVNKQTSKPYPSVREEHNRIDVRLVTLERLHALALADIPHLETVTMNEGVVRHS